MDARTATARPPSIAEADDVAACIVAARTANRAVTARVHGTPRIAMYALSSTDLASMAAAQMECEWEASAG